MSKKKISKITPSKIWSSINSVELVGGWRGLPKMARRCGRTCSRTHTVIISRGVTSGSRLACATHWRTRERKDYSPLTNPHRRLITLAFPCASMGGVRNTQTFNLTLLTTSTLGRRIPLGRIRVDRKTDIIRTWLLIT